MSESLESLVKETSSVTGVELPALLRDGAPTLVVRAAEIYLIGLIGGKDVGKSSLINALAGSDISQACSFGPGTERAIAYVHHDAVAELRTMLNDIPAAQLEIRPHPLDSIRRQVLIDLPDIDSQYADHAELTRKMLRHILFPIWLQSVEKYADQRPAQLLAAVAQGNDAQNFIFCLSKADQVSIDAAGDIASDYADRLMHRLMLPGPPTVLLISSMQPEQFDLPMLRKTLQSQRGLNSVQESTALARRRQESMLRGWLSEQRLDQRTAATERTVQQAGELLTARVGAPLLESALPVIDSDPARRLWMAEPAIDARLTRWPILSIVQSLFGPLIALIRSNLSKRADSGQASIQHVFSQCAGRPLDSLIQSVFAHLKQVNPALGTALALQAYWEPAAAAGAAADLERRLQRVADQQRITAIATFSDSILSTLFAPLRWLATVGVLIWFTLVQPLLSRYLNEGLLPNWHDLAKVIVPLLGASYLLHCAAFLILWFIALWAWLVWRTQRRIAKLLAGWSRLDAAPELSLTAATLGWIEDLLLPLRERHAAAESLSRRVAAALG